MTSTAYDRLNSMEDIEFIAGTQYTLYFEMFEEDGVTVLDITAATVSVRVSYLGQPETAVIDQSGTITDATNGLWNAVLATADTEGLYGVFVVQPYITDFGGDVFPAQGKLVILPKITV